MTDVRSSMPRRVKSSASSRAHGEQRHAVERVFAQVHGGRSRVRLLAEDTRIHLHGAPVASDRADVHAGSFKRGSLLDVQLEVSGGLRRLVVPLPAALVQRVAETHAIQILRLLDVVKLERAREHATAHEARLEPRAFLVRPIDHGEVRRRCKRSCAHGLVDCPRCAQGCDHAVRTVVHAAVFLAVQMRSAQYVRRAIVPGKQPEDITCSIDAHLGARFAQLLGKPCAVCAIVGGESHAVGPTVRLAADGHRFGEQLGKALRGGKRLVHKNLLVDSGLAVVGWQLIAEAWLAAAAPRRPLGGYRPGKAKAAGQTPRSLLR